MNKQRREQILDIVGEIYRLKERLEEIHGEEEEAFESIPEALQETDRAEKMREGLDLMEEVMGYLEDHTTSLEEVIE